MSGLISRHASHSLGCLGLALVLGACGDPIVVLGDTPGQVRNIAGIADSTGTRVDSIATRTRFTFVSAVAFDNDADLVYVADRGSQKQVNGITTRVARLFAVTSAGRISLIMDSGGCLNALPCILDPVSMAVVDDALIIADATGNRVLRFDLAARTFTTIAGTGAAAAATQGAPAATSPLLEPAGVVADLDGTLYVSERGADRVWRIASDGLYSLVAGGGATEIGAPGAATSVRLRRPSGLSVRDGVLYIADTGNHSIEAVDLATGILTRVFGDGFPGFMGDGGPGAAARLQDPRDVVLNPAGTVLYIADTGNHRVRSLDLGTSIVHTYVGTGATEYNGNRLAAGSTTLKDPVDLADADRPFLYIVDQGHSIMRRATLGF